MKDYTFKRLARASGVKSIDVEAKAILTNLINLRIANILYKSILLSTDKKRINDIDTVLNFI